MITFVKRFDEVLWQLAEETYHRDVMSGMHRHAPTAATLEWRDEANDRVRHLQRQRRAVASTTA